jgi:hypothetical protein
MTAKRDSQMPTRRRDMAAGNRIRIEIAGVKRDTRIGDLTVTQFIQLAVQISDQLSRRSQSDAAKMSAVLSQIEAKLTRGRDLRSVSDGIRAAQLAVLRQIPHMMPEFEKGAAAIRSRSARGK